MATAGRPVNTTDMVMAMRGATRKDAHAGIVIATCLCVQKSRAQPKIEWLVSLDAGLRQCSQLQSLSVTRTQRQLLTPMHRH